MQKQVSKQSLAIVALSILLAISMAFTATYALFSHSTTATGSIVFNNGYTVTAANFTDGNSANATAQTMTIEPTYTAGAISVACPEMATGTVAKWTLAPVTSTDTVYVNVTVVAQVKEAGAAEWSNLTTTASSTSAYKPLTLKDVTLTGVVTVTNAAPVVINLTDFLTFDNGESTLTAAALNNGSLTVRQFEYQFILTTSVANAAGTAPFQAVEP